MKLILIIFGLIINLKQAGTVDRIQRTKKVESQITKKMTKRLKNQKTIRPNIVKIELSLTPVKTQIKYMLTL